MIQITGQDRNRILSKFDTIDEVNSTPSPLSPSMVKKQAHDYTHRFHCVPATVKDDSVTLFTYFETNDAIMIRNKAKIHGMSVNVEVV